MLLHSKELVLFKFQIKQFKQVFRESGTITFPKSANNIIVTVVGAGGCGGTWVLYQGNGYGGAGGGAGGYSQKNYGNDLAGQTISFTVGQHQTTAGYAGNPSSFLEQIANGGNGGASWSTGGTGGTASGGDTNNQGQTGTGGGYGSFGKGGIGWSIDGEYFGTGATTNAWNNTTSIVNGIKSGCVFVEYEYKA